MEKKISVMIVDDERFVIEELSTLINWEACGYTIVATAFNGKQALRKYTELHPQVILTDIRMPFMDGIEMIREIRKQDREVNIVLLTAYEDFSYAKAAISLGITEYVMKSEITGQSLTELLANIRLGLLREGEKERIVTDYLLEQFFCQDQESENADLDEFLRQMHNVILIGQDLPLSISGEPLPEEIYVSKERVAQTLRTCDYHGWRLDAITSLPGGQIVLAVNSDTQVYADHTEELEKLAQSVLKTLGEDNESSFSAFYLNHRISLYDLKRYCSENRDRLDIRYFEGSGKVYKLEYPVLTKMETIRELHGSLKAGDAFLISGRENLKRWFDAVYKEVARTYSKEMLINLSRDFYFELRVAYQKIPCFMETGELGIWDNWSYWTDAQKIGQWFADKFDFVTKRFICSSDDQYSKCIVDVIQYIYENYGNPDLSVNDIAEYVHLSAGYLSGAFKKEVGCTIKSYITDVRIQAAKKMFAHGAAKVHEVGEAVGYHSSQYFSQAFYKKTGMLPGEYMKKV